MKISSEGFQQITEKKCTVTNLVISVAYFSAVWTTKDRTKRTLRTLHRQNTQILLIVESWRWQWPEAEICFSLTTAVPLTPFMSHTHPMITPYASFFYSYGGIWGFSLRIQNCTTGSASVVATILTYDPPKLHFSGFPNGSNWSSKTVVTQWYTQLCYFQCDTHNT